jgi:hypothetical protein
MNNNSWIIWNELVKTDFKINFMTIILNYVCANVNRNSLEIKITFENHDTIEKFSNQIFKQYGIDTSFNKNGNSIEIELKNSNHTHDTNNCILENLKFPSNVESIEIINGFNIYTFISISNIKLFNLPDNLSQLKISSSGILFDLSNLPTSLFLLNISECIPKLNLDYLPNGLKILYLPGLYITIKSYFNYSYNLSELSNLPSSLIQINLGHVDFKSINDLMKTLNQKVIHE